MTEWFKQNLTLYSTAESRAAGKLSVLAIIEVIISIIIYWWIAAVWETQLHILVSLIAAPLYLFRSDESVSKAQVMWDEYDKDNSMKRYSLKFWIVLLLAATISGLLSYFLSMHWLVEHQEWVLFWQSALLGWLVLNIAVMVAAAVMYEGLEEGVGQVAIPVALVGAFSGVVTGTVAGALSGVGSVADIGTITIVVGVAILVVVALLRVLMFSKESVALVMGVGVGVGLWLRSLQIRIMSVSTSVLKGVQSAPMNWQRSLWVEDFTVAPELIPGIKIGSNYSFERRLKDLQLPSKSEGFTTSIVILPIFFFPALIWRLSLKSTVWFYASIFLMNKPGDLAEAGNRLRFFTRGPTLWEIWRMCFAVIGLTVAVISLIDIFVAFEFWRGLSNEAPLSPIGWLLVMDWERFFNQPWQWFSLPAAFLTVFLYLWVNQIRVHRDADVKLGQDPEVHNSAENHPGITIYWLDRLRNVLVVVSLVVGFWYFVKWAYLADNLTPINPWLSSIFGPLPL